MKILTINASDIQGGAARAAYRLHQGLLRIGLGSELFVQGRRSNDPHVHGPRNPWARLMARARPTLDMRPVRNYPNFGRKLFSPAWVTSTGLVDRINSSDAEVVHLHWVNGGMLRIEDVPCITKPLVWSMHDMWPFTGGCHYDEGCGRYTSHCGSCPILGSDREKDLSHQVFDRKSRAWSTSAPITFIGLSKWIAASARSSRLLPGHEVVELPNPIDTEIYKPVDRQMARQQLGLPQDRKLVLFGAVNATEDPRKGFTHLRAALEQIADEAVELVIFGSDEPADPPRLGHPMHYMGQLSDDRSLCLLYNAADVTVVPSIQENLSNTIVESLACGTPAVAFDIGGNPDMIDHQRNGYLARPFEPADLSAGVTHVLDRMADGAMRTEARDSALRRFELEMVSHRYRELYEKVMGRRKG